MSAGVGHLGWLGFIIFGIVEGSLFFTILAAIFGGRRSSPNPGYAKKVPLVFIGALVGLLATIVAGLWVAGLIFSLFMV